MDQENETKQKFRDFDKNLISFLTKGWLSNPICAYLSSVRVAPEQGSSAILKAFNNAPHSMQWGVYQDFFERCGIFPEVKDCHGDEMFSIDSEERYHSTVHHSGGHYYPLEFNNDKEEARKSAVKAAIELYQETEILKYTI